MAQLRHDYPQFKALHAEVLVMVPNGPRMIERYLHSHTTPYPILSDKGSQVTGVYQIERKRALLLTAFKPGVFLVEKMGKLCYTSYTTSYIQEPDNREPLAVLARLAGAKAAPSAR